MAATCRRARGFSLIELSMAMALMTLVCATAFGLLHPARGTFAAEPEVADIQQRARVAADALTKDLLMAGAGAYQGARAGSLLNYFAPVRPSWQNGISAALDVFSVASTAVQTTLIADLTPGAGSLEVAAVPNCPIGAALCGIAPGMTLLVYDDSGHADIFSVASVNGIAAQVQIATPGATAATTTYGIGSTVVEAQVHSYALKASASMPGLQLTRDDAPTVDHVVGIEFDYYGEPQPPTLAAGAASYGPSPPALGVQSTGYPPGESCTFAVDSNGVQVPRLPLLGSNTTLVPLAAPELSDGPWCPDAADPNRWDADLLRIRRIGVTLRVEAALAALRGPAGVLFTNGGSSRNAGRWVPDQVIRWIVSPRNLGAGR